MRLTKLARLWIVLCRALPATARAEDGYKLWLRYAPVADDATRAAYIKAAREIYVPGDSPTANVILAELQNALQSMLGVKVPVVQHPSSDGGTIVVELFDQLPADLGDEGY